MNVEILMSSFDVSIAYGVVLMLANKVLTLITPVLFLMAVSIRIMETQLEGLTSGGKWSSALKDIFMLGAAIGVYFGAFALIAVFANTIYAWIEHTGSISAITDRFNGIIDGIKAKRGEQSYLDFALGITAVPFQAISLPFYEGTLLLAAFFTLFLKLAHAFGFGVAFVWGLIAIPMSVTSNLKLLRGWGLLVGFILAWPLVEGLIISLFAPMFQNSADRLVQDINTNADWNLVGVHLLFGLAHLLLVAILVAAPMITVYLTANAASGGALILPFGAAAMGAAAALFKGKLRIPLNGPAKQQTPAPSLQSVPRPLSTARMSGGNPVREVPPLIRAETSRGSRSPRQATGEPTAHQTTSGTEVSPEPATATSIEAATRKKQQTRRGVLIQQRNKPKAKPQ